MTWSRLGHPNVVWALMLALAVALAPGRDTDRSREGESDADGDRRGFDSPGEAMEWVLQAHRDERGNIPRDGLIRARAQADVMRRASAAESSQAIASGAPAAAGISRNAWTWIGPSNIGGRVRAVVIPPNAPSTILTGGVAGGIWKSTNAGATWRNIDDFLANLAVSCMVFQPTDPNRLFVGTGEGFFNSDSIRGAGIFTSTNQGETWTQLPSTANVSFDFVNRLAFSSDGSILLAATRTGLFRSLDLGGSWTQVSTQVDMFDVKFIGGSSTQVVAAGRRRNAFHSSNGGQSWNTSGGLTATTQAMRVELAVSASSPNVVYASLEENDGQIWKSTDYGANYAKVSDPAHLENEQGWYDNALWVDPVNADHVIAGGVRLFRSTNGGLSFSVRANCHADQHAIVHDPGYNGTTNRRVYIGSDGGVCKIEDVSVNTVTNLRNGLGITQFYGADGLSSDGRIFGGTQDNGTLLYNPASGIQAWTTVASGDGGFSTADRVNNFLYGEFQYLGVHRSVNGGPGSLITGCSKPAPFRLDDGCTSSTTTTNFIAPILLDPNTPDRLLAGGRSLWRTDDPRTANTATTGPTWRVIKPAGTANISAIAVAQGNSDIVWIGHSNGDLFVTLNGTADTPTWTKSDGSLPNRVVTSVAIDRGDPRIAYVSLGGFSPDNLWRTTNTGATWQDVTGSGGGGLPDVPIRSIVIHPFVSDWLVAATDVGVFTTESGGAIWSLPHDGPANVAVFQLFWLDANLVAVTHGRGMYTTPAASTVPAFARHPTSQAVISGHAVAFNPIAVGIGPLSYQWYRGQRGDTSDPIPGATSSRYTTPPITAPASFWVRVTNELGSADSNTAVLTLSHWATLLPGVTNQGGAAEPTIVGGSTTSATADASANRSGSAATSAKSVAPVTAAASPRSAVSSATTFGPASGTYSTPAAATGSGPTPVGNGLTTSGAFRPSSGNETTLTTSAASGVGQPRSIAEPTAPTRESATVSAARDVRGVVVPGSFPTVVAGSQPVPTDPTRLVEAADLPNVLPRGRSEGPRVTSPGPTRGPGVTSPTDVVQHATAPATRVMESAMVRPMIVIGFGIFLPPLVAHLWLRRRRARD